MGRPRVVRSVEEERALKERRREQEREWARKRREADAAERVAASSSSSSASVSDEEVRLARLEHWRQRRRRANTADEERAANSTRMRAAARWAETNRRLGPSPAERFPRATAMFERKEESKQLPRAPPPPPPTVAAAEQGQLLFLLKQNGPCQPQRLLLPRLQQQVQLRLGAPGEAASVFVTAANSPLPPAAASAQGTTPLQANGVLLEQHGGLANGQPDPDTRPVVTEEHFRAGMLQQTTQQTALLQGLLGEQRRIAEAAERQARALEEQSHAVSQLLLLMMGNQRNNDDRGGGPSASDVPLALLTPDMVQVEHSGPDT